jgi:hypothetical protein
MLALAILYTGIALFSLTLLRAASRGDRVRQFVTSRKSQQQFALASRARRRLRQLTLHPR